jgi:hypothetical protein
MLEVRGEQDARRLRVRDDPVLVALAGLGADAQEPMGGLDVTGLEPAQLLSAKPGVVGQGEHAAVADGLAARLVEQAPPLLVVGNPRELLAPREQPALTLARTEALAGGVAATTDGIGVAAALLDEVVEEEADRRDPLLHRRVREPGTGLHRDNVGSACAGSIAEIADEACDLGASRVHGIDAALLAPAKEVFQATRVRFDRVDGEPERVLNLEPLLALSEGIQLGKSLTPDLVGTVCHEPPETRPWMTSWPDSK